MKSIKAKQKLRQLLHKVYYPHAFYWINRIRPTRSHAQFFEDIVLEKLLGRVRRFIDIGAYNGISGSNTLYFALRGAEGLLFEPIKATFRNLNRLYWTKPGMICVNEGISNEMKTLEMSCAGALSYSVETQDIRHTRGNEDYFPDVISTEFCRVRPLSYWLGKFRRFKNIDFISIDVEGHENAVLEGIDFNDCSVRVFVIETHGRDKYGMWLSQDYESIKKILNKNGYRVLLISPENSFWFKESEVEKLDLNSIVEEFPSYRKCAPDIFVEDAHNTDL